jgi:hypothetical protein
VLQTLLEGCVPSNEFTQSRLSARVDEVGQTALAFVGVDQQDRRAIAAQSEGEVQRRDGLAVP